MNALDYEILAIVRRHSKGHPTNVWDIRERLLFPHSAKAVGESLLRLKAKGLVERLVQGMTPEELERYCERRKA